MLERIPGFLALLLCASTAFAASKSTLDKNAQLLLNKHVATYKDKEFFSGAALSIYIPKQPIHSYYAGTVSHEDNSSVISADTLFQIGSITKSFTAAVLLQLEKEGKLKLNDTIEKWLPNYSKWSNVNLAALLNMSSGLPNYSDTPAWNMAEYNDPTRSWRNEELVAFVYPHEDITPPIKSGFFYSNTGYVLTDMIIEKVTGHTFKEEITNRLFNVAGLQNTYYPVPDYTDTVTQRMAHAYNYNQYDNPLLVGKDVTDVNMSWGAAAGGIVSNTEDIIKWVKALFIDDKILDRKQKSALTSMISLKDGKPAKNTSAQNPKAFGLGVIQAYDDTIGRFWYYEGETLGFRALYMYTPCNNVIISSIFNSATNSENDRANELMKNAYQMVLKENPKLRCKS